MSDHAQYALNSAAWFTGGCVVSAVYWRTYIHRRLVREGAVTREQPLAVFMAILVGLVSIMGLLFSESSRLALSKYINCQATVNQNNVDTINDRSKSAVTQLEKEIAFYRALAMDLSSPPGPLTQRRVLGSVVDQIAVDGKRLRVISNNPLQATTDCHKDGSS